MLAVITGSTVLAAFVWLVVAAVMFYLCNWLLGWIPVTDPFLKPAKAIIGLVVIVVIINALLTLAGRPFIVLW